jgi:hypothetical protein
MANDTVVVGPTANATSYINNPQNGTYVMGIVSTHLLFSQLNLSI